MDAWDWTSEALAMVPENANDFKPKLVEPVVCVGEWVVVVACDNDLQTSAVNFLAFHLNCICMACTGKHRE